MSLLYFLSSHKDQTNPVHLGSQVKAAKSILLNLMPIHAWKIVSYQQFCCFEQESQCTTPALPLVHKGLSQSGK